MITARDLVEGSGMEVEGEGDGGWEITALLRVAQNSYRKQKQAPSTAKAMDFQLPENGVDQMHEAGEMKISLPPLRKTPLLLLISFLS